MALEMERTTSGDPELRAWRVQVLNVLLTVTSIVGAPVTAWTVYVATMDPRQWTAALIFLGIYLFLLALAIFRRLDPRLRAWGFLLVGYLAGVIAFARGGLAGDGRVFLLVLPAVALILVGVRSGAVMALLSVLAFVVFTVLAQQGWMEGWLVHLDNPLTLEPWVYGGAVFAMLLGLLLLLLWRFHRFQMGTLRTARRTAAELAQAQTLLQERADRLEEANRLLQERTHALETAAEVARQIAALREEGELVERFVNLLCERFVLYHVGLFRLDRRREYAVLQIASSEGGKRLVERGYRVPLDTENPVAEAVRSGRRVFLPSSAPVPELRWTRWQIVFPLQARGEVLGALDIHIADEQPPSEEQIEILQTLVDQFTVGLENARLFERIRESLEELSRVYQVMTVEAWEQFVEEGPGVQRYWVEESPIPEEVWRPLFEEARLRGKPVSARVGEEGDGRYALAVPVKLRGVSIGVIGFHRPVEAGAWQPREITLAEAVAERMALALENVRLLEETRRRAARERAVSEVTARLARSLDVEGVLRAAARELGQLPQVVEAVVQLVPPEAEAEPSRPAPRNQA